MFLGFVAYQVTVEEFHWRIHLGGWLPPGLQWTREYHLAHHDRPDGRFNIFLPVFDAVFALPQLVKRGETASVFSIIPGAGSPLSVFERSMLAWLFALAVAANLFNSASPANKAKVAPVQHTQQTE
jgi:hypothetical protein